jgi:hypothetical protein
MMAAIEAALPVPLRQPADPLPMAT